MSGFVTEPLRSDEAELAFVKDGEVAYIRGQRHDRIPNGAAGGGSSSNEMDDIEPNLEPELEIEISASQKMLSAVSGSLLTSLLGESPDLSYLLVHGRTI